MDIVQYEKNADQNIWKNIFAKSRKEGVLCIAKKSSREPVPETNILHVSENTIRTFKEKFDEYFIEEMKICQPVTWIANPFQSDRSTRILLVADEELIDVSEDTVLNMNFNRNMLMQFWLNALQTYPNISAASSESQFRNRLQLSGSLRLKVTANEVDIDAILKGSSSFACGTL
ncbi:hypothetical protein T11_6634 [Trichinella zimbabwensis]|uniref:Uncharacterized protein n=1 Tax=Trichinella zimbabwensis TaxID=268475 RepID=A0A0V1HPN8_9BILA|nr:hypothetical protein T11_6634 [Trichinella zimbabwensis]